MSRIANYKPGITAEKAICIAFNIHDNIKAKCIDKELLDKLLTSNIIADICQKNGILPHTWIGGKNGKTDFMGFSRGKEISISLKTLKRLDGKIGPSCSQLSHTGKNGDLGAFHTKHFPECPRPAQELSRVDANILRWNWIKSNIGMYLNKMQKQLFCCDVLVLISNCSTTPQAEIIENKNCDFTQLTIEYNHPIYAENPHPRKIGELSEFWTKVFHTLADKTEVEIGEFQFHFKSRNEVKFRFKNEFYY